MRAGASSTTSLRRRACSPTHRARADAEAREARAGGVAGERPAVLRLPVTTIRRAGRRARRAAGAPSDCTQNQRTPASAGAKSQRQRGSGEGARRHAAHHDRRDAAGRERREKVRPELGLAEEDEPRPYAIERAPDHGREIEWKEQPEVGVGNARHRRGATADRHAREHEALAGELLTERSHDRGQRRELADRGPVDPDGRPIGRRRRHAPEALGQADPPLGLQRQRRQRHGQQQHASGHDRRMEEAEAALPPFRRVPSRGRCGAQYCQRPLPYRKISVTSVCSTIVPAAGHRRRLGRPFLPVLDLAVGDLADRILAGLLLAMHVRSVL